uniref:Uncharacterized protein n=1 Tax=Oryctolagus cuniculus TaxID=9986 RepID=G1SE94_RABIT
MQAALPRAKKQVAPASDEGAAQPRPPSDTAQVPQWLYKAIMSLYILLALAFLLCIILSALVLVKYSEMSEELKDLRTQLWNGEQGVQERGCSTAWVRGGHHTDTSASCPQSPAGRNGARSSSRPAGATWSASFTRLQTAFRAWQTKCRPALRS